MFFYSKLICFPYLKSNLFSKHIQNTCTVKFRGSLYKPFGMKKHTKKNTHKKTLIRT